MADHDNPKGNSAVGRQAETPRLKEAIFRHDGEEYLTLVPATPDPAPRSQDRADGVDLRSWYAGWDAANEVWAHPDAEPLRPAAGGDREAMLAECESAVVQFARAVADGERVPGYGQFLVVENPAYEADNGESPHLVVSAESVAATILALAQAPALQGGDEGWRPLDDCPSDGRPLWVLGGQFDEPTRRQADGEYWRAMRKRGDRNVPTLWHPEFIPAPPPVPASDPGPTATASEVRS